MCTKKWNKEHTPIQLHTGLATKSECDCETNYKYLVLARWIKLRKAAKWYLAHSFAQTRKHSHTYTQALSPLNNLTILYSLGSPINNGCTEEENE